MNYSRSKIIILVLIVLLAAWFRWPGLSQPYHQDEYKWAAIVAKDSPLAGTIPHPPLSEITYRLSDRLFGNNHLRFTPFILSLLNLLLLVAIVRYRFGERTAIWVGIVFAVSFYSILASLMVDTDGQVLPFFLLLTVYVYDRFNQAKTTKTKWWWGITVILCSAVGMLVKLSFVIAIGAVIVDFVIQKWNKFSKKQWGYALGIAAIIMAVTATFILNSSHLDYWERFFVILDRAWLQIIIQSLKALFFVSPLLLAPLVLLSRADWSRARIWWLYIASGLLFYLVIFDFSAGALDRYLQFLILPLAVLSGIGLSRAFDRHWEKWSYQWLSGGSIAIVAVFLSQWLPHFIPPHYPKTEWFSRVVELKWNFLFPFSGGSGPLGFYISFLFMASIFVISVALVGLIWRQPVSRKNIAIILLGLGLTYNGVFIEEYLFGKINGSAPKVLVLAETFIKENNEIEKVITYNDTGAYELQRMGKYEQRIYAVPEWEGGYKETLNKFQGHYLVVDIPQLNPGSLYAKYFSTCAPIFKTVDQKITAVVYDCHEAPEVK